MKAPITTHDFSLQPNKRIYAIGDIHGYADVLNNLHKKIEQDLRDNPIDKAFIIYLGDYIDRGPSSKGVIDMLINRQKNNQDFKHIFLLGNHEDAMLKFIDDPHGPRQDWVLWGGIEAMESYGMTIARDYKLTEVAEDLVKELHDALPADHLGFYKNLRTHHVEDEYIFAHAGILPNTPIEEQSTRDLTFTREPFLSHKDLHTHYVVHGHTIENKEGALILPNRMNLDSGLYEGGPLSCGVFEANTIRVIEARA